MNHFENGRIRAGIDIAKRFKNSDFNPLTPDSYVQAKKRPDGKFQLFYIGTMNEVFPGELFSSSSEARQYFKVQKIKAGNK